jgi:hypothetical protein
MPSADILTSGKSSVLEALLELPFARDSGLCTRFATQITMRRTNFDSITISIIPAATASAERAAKLRAFKKEGVASLNCQGFLDIFQEVIVLVTSYDSSHADQDCIGM